MIEAGAVRSDRTGRLSAEDWAQAVLKLAGDSAERARLGEAAQRLVLSSHRSSDQVSGLLVTLEKALRGGAIPFVAGDARSMSGRNER